MLQHLHEKYIKSIPSNFWKERIRLPLSHTQ